MDLVMTAGAFLIGIHLCFRAMASWYAAIDHRDAIDRRYHRVATGIALWCAAFVGLGLWLPDPFGHAYWSGAASSVCVLGLITAVCALLPRAAVWQDRIEYRRLLKDEAARKR